MKYHYKLLLQCNGKDCYSSVINPQINFHGEEYHEDYISCSTLLSHNMAYYIGFCGLVTKYSDEEKLHLKLVILVHILLECFINLVLSIKYSCRQLSYLQCSSKGYFWWYTIHGKIWNEQILANGKFWQMMFNSPNFSSPVSISTRPASKFAKIFHNICVVSDDSLKFSSSKFSHVRHQFCYQYERTQTQEAMLTLLSR